MSLAATIRLVTLASALVFAVVVLGISAALIAKTQDLYGAYYRFSALALATALITLLTVVPM